MPTQRTTSAAYWKRSLAFIIDLILYAAIGWLTLYLFTVIITLIREPHHTVSTITEILQWGLAGLFFFIGLLLYSCLFELSPWRATPGKKLLSLRVQSEKKEELTNRQILTRNFTKPFTLYVLFTEFDIIANKESRQLLHDAMARCEVVEE